MYGTVYHLTRLKQYWQFIDGIQGLHRDSGISLQTEVSMMELYDKVKIKRNNRTGIIVDITLIDGKEIFTTEDDIEKNDKSGKNWLLYQCERNEIELME